MWGTEPSQQCGNFFCNSVQAMGHPPGWYGILFYCGCAPPSISLRLLSLDVGYLFFGGFQCPPVSGRSTARCNLGALAGWDSSAFSKPSLYIWKFLVHVLLKAILKDFEHNLTSPWNQFCWLNFAHSRLIHVFCDSGLSVHTWYGFICGNIMEGLCFLYFLLPIHLLKSIEYFQLNFWLESFEIK